jgi:tetratricopeptide (TPR) repeat protein
MFGVWHGVFLLLLVSLESAFVFAQVDLRANALALEQQGQNDRAEQIWKTIAKMNPKTAEPFAHVGLLEARRGSYSVAIEDYRKAIEQAPSMQGLQMNLGLAYFKTNQFADAIKAFSIALKQERPGSPAASRLVILLGMAHYAKGDYLLAIPYLQKAAKDDSQSLPLRLALAHSCMWSKQYDCVMKVDKEILALDADSAEADILAGEALDEKGDDAGAIEQFRNAVEADPEQPRVHFGLGYLLWKQHNFEEAVKEFQAALRNDPGDQRARAYLGDSLVELNQYQTAQPELEMAVRDSSVATMAMIHSDLGVVYTEAGRNDMAANELLQAIALDPKKVSPHWRLGRLYRSMGRKEEAEAEFAIASAMVKNADKPLAEEMDGNRAKKHP